MWKRNWPFEGLHASHAEELILESNIHYCDVFDNIKIKLTMDAVH